MTGVQYTVIFRNNSTQAGDVCLFQQQPGAPNAFSLAWFAHYAYPTTDTIFNWSIDYSFIWSETGTLMPGVIFSPSQSWNADLTNRNAVTLAYNNFFTFEDQHTGPQPGSLYINSQGSVPMNTASVGIGMSGAGTFVEQARPNLTTVFTPHPEYWITFGLYEQGEVLDPESMNNRAIIAFPPGVYSMTAVLNQDNSWTIEPTNRTATADRDVETVNDADTVS